MTTDRSEIQAVREALRTAVNAGDVAAILACWAPDGVLMPPHHPRVEGHAAMAAYFGRVFKSRRLTFIFTDAIVTVVGDVAFERLNYTAVAMPIGEGQPTDDAGKGLHVYARQPDGSWRLVQDIWNSDR